MCIRDWRQVRRIRWPWYAGAFAAIVILALGYIQFGDDLIKDDVPVTALTENIIPRAETPPAGEPVQKAATLPQPEASPTNLNESAPGSETTMADVDIPASLDSQWLDDHQEEVWLGLAELWKRPGEAFSIQAACNGDESVGYACLQDQGNWSRIKRLGLPVVLVLHDQEPSYLLLQGLDNERLRVGRSDQMKTVSRDSVEPRWLGSYLVAWPQSPGWPAFISRGDSGPAVDTIMEMAARVDMPYQGPPVFDAGFELWLKGFQRRNGLGTDGIVGRNTLLHLMTASIDEPKLMQAWE